MIHRLVVPLDGSELAEKTLPYALQLTKRLQMETTLLHVCGSGETASQFMCKSYIEHVAETLSSQLAENEEKPVPLRNTSSRIIKTEVMTGDVSSSILDYAEKNKADLILMSRRGHSGVGRWLIGSIAHKVLSASNVPVLIIHPGGTEINTLNEWPRTALVLMDGSRLSETILGYVENIFEPGRFTGEVTLFRVCEPPDLLSDYPQAIMPHSWNEHVTMAKAATEQSCSIYLTEIQRRLETKNIHTSLKVALGENVVDEIIKFARQRFDLIAMTTHGRSGLSQWPYGHVADRIIQASSSPLLLVRPPANTPT